MRAHLDKGLWNSPGISQRAASSLRPDSCRHLLQPEGYVIQGQGSLAGVHPARHLLHTLQHSLKLCLKALQSRCIICLQNRTQCIQCMCHVPAETTQTKSRHVSDALSTADDSSQPHAHSAQRLCPNRRVALLVKHYGQVDSKRCQSSTRTGSRNEHSEREHLVHNKLEHGCEVCRLRY